MQIRNFMSVCDLRDYIPNHPGRQGSFALYSAVDYKIYFGAGYLETGGVAQRFNDIYTVDARDDTFEYLSDAQSHLDVQISHPGAIMVDATIRFYGGQITGGNSNIIQYGTIPTTAPTSNPSAAPSKPPTAHPSTTPSKGPTSHPSRSTANPSTTPS
eukprot:555358_1